MDRTEGRPTASLREELAREMVRGARPRPAPCRAVPSDSPSCRGEDPWGIAALKAHPGWPASDAAPAGPRLRPDRFYA